jgi:hypothetical protein
VVSLDDSTQNGDDVDWKPELTFNPYCNFAIIGLSDMNPKSFLLTVKGSGTMRPMKTTISKTRRTNTLENANVSDETA